MVRLIIRLLCFFLLVSSFSFGQQMKISGTVYDTSGVQPLNKALVMAVRMSDSLLLGFTRTDENGYFTLNNFPVDTFTLVIAHPKYGDKNYFIFGNADNADITIPKIKMEEKVHELQEIVVYTNKNPIYFKGDTLVYVADSFKVGENAVVEDLLKKLPGITVNSDGSITSQGKEISKVLVDGDEFFGSDPTIATKNLGAKGVESVQVYEKKNENAKDGEDETIQVLDLKLKEDAKKGYFGKISGASDFGITLPDKTFYEGEFMANKFSGAQKISVFALTSNTPKSSLGFGDMNKFGLDNELQSSGMSMWNQNGQNTTNGVPKTFKTGIYYSDKIGKTGKLNFNYSYYNYQLDSRSNSRSQYLLTDTTYYTNDTTVNITKNESHKVNLKYTVDLDSLTHLEINPSISYDLGTTDDRNITAFSGEDFQQSLKTDVHTMYDSKGFSSESDFRLRRNFKKPKRELDLYYYLETSNNKNKGKLYTLSDYAASSLNDTIDQYKDYNNSEVTQIASLEYTEPISKYTKLSVEYQYENDRSKQSKLTYNELNGAYTDEVTSLSNVFKTLKQENRVTFTGSYEKKKHSFSIGVAARNIEIGNHNLVSGSIIHQSFNNLLPKAQYRYKPNQTSRFEFNYFTSSSQPTISDLQPVPDNLNPNSIKTGNPNLKPNYTHQLRVNYNTWNSLSGRFIWSGISGNFINNAFGNSTTYDNYGRTVSQTVNVDGNISSYLYAGAGFPFFNRKLTVMPNTNASFIRNTNYINTLKNRTDNRAISGGLELRFEFDSLEFGVEGTVSYTNPLNSLSTISSTAYTTQKYNADFKWTMPWWHMTLKSSATYTKNNRLASGYNQGIFVWNAEISKAFLKTENLLLGIEAYDIFNQNKTIQRQVTNNTITDNYTTIISRYFLLRLTWKFNNNKTKEKDYEGWH